MTERIQILIYYIINATLSFICPICKELTSFFTVSHQLSSKHFYLFLNESFRITIVKLRCCLRFHSLIFYASISYLCSDEDDDEENDAKDFIAKDEDARWSFNFYILI